MYLSTLDLSALDLQSLDLPSIKRILLQEDESYKRGQALGQEGKAPELKDYFPFLSDNIFALSTAPGPLDKSSFEHGYNSGLESFMQSHRIEGDVTVLSQLEAMTGFIKGANLQTPGIESFDSFDYPKKTKAGDYLILTSSKGSRQAYNLGFRVAIARDYNITLESEQVPFDNGTYQIFMQGLRGEARSTEHDTHLLYKRYHEALANLARLNTRIYESGLNVWLQSQGIKTVKAKQISDPESLRTFKLALNGEVLPEYEPKTLTEDDLNIINSEYVLKEFYKEIPSKKDLLKEFNPVLFPSLDLNALNQALGQVGYDLGKEARIELQG